MIAWNAGTVAVLRVLRTPATNSVSQTQTHMHTHTNTQSGSSVSESVCESHFGYAASWFYNSCQHGTVVNIPNSSTVRARTAHTRTDMELHAHHSSAQIRPKSFGHIRICRHKKKEEKKPHHTYLPWGATADESEGERRDPSLLCVLDTLGGSGEGGREGVVDFCNPLSTPAHTGFSFSKVSQKKQIK